MGRKKKSTYGLFPTNEVTEMLGIYAMCKINNLSYDSIIKKYITGHIRDDDGSRAVQMIETSEFGNIITIFDSLCGNVDRIVDFAISYLASKLDENFKKDLLERFITSLNTKYRKLPKTGSSGSFSRLVKPNVVTLCGTLKVYGDEKEFENMPDGHRLLAAVGRVYSQNKLRSDIEAIVALGCVMVVRDNFEKVKKALHIDLALDDFDIAADDSFAVFTGEYQLIKWIFDELENNKERKYKDFDADRRGMFLEACMHGVGDFSRRDKNRLKDRVTFAMKGLTDKVLHTWFSKEELYNKRSVLLRDRAKKAVELLGPSSSGPFSDIGIKDSRYGVKYSRHLTLISLAEHCVENRVNYALYKEDAHKVSEQKRQIDKLERELKRKAEKVEKRDGEIRRLKESLDGVQLENKELQKKVESISEDTLEEHNKEVKNLRRSLRDASHRVEVERNKNKQAKGEIDKYISENEELKENISALEEIIDNIESDEDTEQVEKEFDKQDELRQLIRNRRVWIIGGTNVWRDRVSKEFTRSICKSCHEMGSGFCWDKIQRDDIVIIQLMGMKHCVSIPTMQRCRDLGVPYTLVHVTNKDALLNMVYDRMLNRLCSTADSEVAQ